MSAESSWTTEETIAHGREWLAAGWVWAPGQAFLASSKDGRIEQGYALVSQLAYDGRPVNGQWEAVPDMRDPGTRGHALDQVREALGDPNVSVAKNGMAWSSLSTGLCSPWPCNRQGRRVRVDEHTESEALLAARRAAP